MNFSTEDEAEEMKKQLSEMDFDGLKPHIDSAYKHRTRYVIDFAFLIHGLIVWEIILSPYSSCIMGVMDVICMFHNALVHLLMLSFCDNLKQ